MTNNFKLIFAIMLFLVGFLARPNKILAQEPNYACMGPALATYMNTVISGAGNLPNIRLLSPAFNMTSYTFEGIVKAMDAAGANWGGLDGISGNAYNIAGRGTTDWVREKMEILRSVAPEVTGKKVLLTETGIRDGTLGDLAIELNKIKSGSAVGVDYLGALLFNSFNANNDWVFFALSENDINTVCGGACGNIGENTATAYYQDLLPENSQYGCSSIRPFYQCAQFHSMGFVLEIANNGARDSAEEGIRRALSAGLKPVIRIGVGTDSGGFFDPNTYVNFLTDISGRFSPTDVIYAIAGPNEPETENWAHPQCGGAISGLPNRGPLEEGFHVGAYACNETAPDEFHPLRPYPANACDPLIPKTDPEAPATVNKKYLTFACGTNVIPSALERFDPYGDNTAYEVLSATSRATGEDFRHTWCDPRPETFIPCSSWKVSGGVAPCERTPMTCYRSEPFLLNFDFTSLNLGILGNTQNPNLTDKQKVNGYLSYYFTGVPQIGDHKLLDPYSPIDQYRVVNYTGPVRKLFPKDMQNLIRQILPSLLTSERVSFSGVHNYEVNEEGTYRLSNFAGGIPGWIRTLYENIPLSSLEDIAGEVLVTAFQPGQTEAGMQHQDVTGPITGTDSTGTRSTAPTEIFILKAVPASVTGPWYGVDTGINSGGDNCGSGVEAEVSVNGGPWSRNNHIVHMEDVVSYRPSPISGNYANVLSSQPGRVGYVGGECGAGSGAGNACPSSFIVSNWLADVGESFPVKATRGGDDFYHCGDTLYITISQVVAPTPPSPIIQGCSSTSPCPAGMMCASGVCVQAPTPTPTPTPAPATACASGTTCYVFDPGSSFSCSPQTCSFSGGGQGNFCCQSIAVTCPSGQTCRISDTGGCTPETNGCIIPGGGEGNYCCP